jgi:hypothetical protein
MEESRMPDFLIIGAAKSGTTSLYFLLNQHPQIFLPFNKEPNFFRFEGQDIGKFLYRGKIRGVRNSIVTLTEYQRLFEHQPKNILAGEASTLYLPSERAADGILHHVPECKILAILRNPVDRAFSHFSHFRRDGYEPVADFMQAIQMEPKRISENWFPSYFYLEAGFYFRHLSIYFHRFSKEQIKIILFEDLRDPAKVLQEIYEFLNVETRFPSDISSRHNPSGRVRIPWLYHLLRDSRWKDTIRTKIPVPWWSKMRSKWEAAMIAPNLQLSAVNRRQVRALYLEDIEKLEELLDRDLRTWKMDL